MLVQRKYRILAKTLTPRKIWNAAKITSSFYLARATKKPIHFGMPLKIGIEPTTSCNLRCPECLSGLRGFTRPTGNISLDDFKQLTDEVAKDLIYMLLYFQGEPFLHPDFLEMVKYASARGVFTATSTNGHYLTGVTPVSPLSGPKVVSGVSPVTRVSAKKVVESGLSELLISVDGTTQETYEQYRVRGKLSKVFEGIKSIVAARKELKSLTPHIVIQFLAVKPNEHQIPEIQALGKELGVDKVLIKTAQIADFENGNPLIPENRKYSRYKEVSAGKFEHKSALKNECWKLWQGAEITWDGKVLPCCFDKDATHEMGSLNGIRFKEIWSNEKYREFRQNLIKSRASNEMCQNCTEGSRIFS